MKRAIVLSGGGAKGAYQIGFWKAIRKLGINYDIVTGTSIGALNGVFLVQGNYGDAIKLWNSINYEKVINDSMKGSSYYTIDGKKKLVLSYAKAASKGGFDVEGLKKIIDSNLKVNKFYNSNVDYGLVTVKFPSLKPVMLTKKEIEPKLLSDYLLASASCFPAFKMKEINEEKYIDGGYYDNMPINLAIEMGAEEIIAVDLRAPGKKRLFNAFEKSISKNIPVKIITSKSNMGNFLVMEKKQAKRLMKIGYNDTMKAFNKLEGDSYTFKKDTFKRNYKKTKELFYYNLDIYFEEKNNYLYKRLNGINKHKYFDSIIENLMKAFSFDDTKIYNGTYINNDIKKAYKKNKQLTFNNIKNYIKNNKLNKSFIDKELICFLYKEICKKSKLNKKVMTLAMLFPESFLCAIYLKTIIDK